MRTIQAKSLSIENFKKYGVFQNLLDNQSLANTSIRSSGFFPDLLTLNFGTTTLPSVCVCNVQKTEKNIVSFLEAHQYTCEGLLPIDGDVIIYTGILGFDGFSVDALEAFIVPKGTFVKLNPLIVHGTQYTIDTDEAHILCLLPERTFRNDTMFHSISNETDMVEIVL